MLAAKVKSAMSNPNATPSGGQVSMPLNEMVLWLKGDAGHGSDLISFWADDRMASASGAVPSAGQP